MSYITVDNRVLVAGRMGCLIKSNREIGGRGMFGRVLVSGIIAHHPQWWATGRLVQGSCRWSEPIIAAEKGFEHPVTLPAEQGKGGVDLAPSLPVGY
jgi:hypothetical protein